MSAQALVAALGWTLVQFVWQGALIGCAVAVLLTVLRNARPETRYAVACLGLLSCLAWPAVDLALCSFRPALEHGKPVQQLTHVQYVWSLQ